MPKFASITEFLRTALSGPAVAMAIGVAAGVPVAAADGGVAPARVPSKRVDLGSSAAFSGAGVLYAVSKQGDHVMLYRSDDDGRNWSPPVVVNDQPEAIAADGESKPNLAFAADGALVVSWTKPLSRPYTGEVRLSRSEDGRVFSAPMTVHRDRAEITHRFDSMIVAPDGRIYVAWIDKRDLEAAKEAKAVYRGAAIYAAVSVDGGKTFLPEQKVADHSCECCRIAMTLDRDGRPLLMWRHVFAPNERDHAIARLGNNGTAESVVRATFDRWKLDGCPHHGPSLAVDATGTRHAVWFNYKDGVGHVFYGRLAKDGNEGRVEGQRMVGGERAEHADLAVSGRRVALVWKEFDGQRTVLRAEISDDGGETFRGLDPVPTAGASDQVRALVKGDSFFAFWRTEREGMRVIPLH